MNHDLKTILGLGSFSISNRRRFLGKPRLFLKRWAMTLRDLLNLGFKNKVCDDWGYRAFENCNMIEHFLLNQALCGNNRNLRPWQLRQFLRLYFAGPLQQAHGQDPQCLHPISLHLMASDVIPPLEAKSNWWYVTAQKYQKNLETSHYTLTLSLVAVSWAVVGPGLGRSGDWVAAMGQNEYNEWGTLGAYDKTICIGSGVGWGGLLKWED